MADGPRQELLALLQAQVEAAAVGSREDQVFRAALLACQSARMHGPFHDWPPRDGRQHLFDPTPWSSRDPPWQSRLPSPAPPPPAPPVAESAPPPIAVVLRPLRHGEPCRSFRWFRITFLEHFRQMRLRVRWMRAGIHGLPWAYASKAVWEVEALLHLARHRPRHRPVVWWRALRAGFHPSLRQRSPPAAAVALRRQFWRWVLAGLFGQGLRGAPAFVRHLVHQVTRVFPPDPRALALRLVRRWGPLQLPSRVRARLSPPQPRPEWAEYAWMRE